jgi:hypothetical protein
MASVVVRPGGPESSIDVIDLLNGRRAAQLQRIHDSYQDRPVFSPDGRLLVAGPMSGEILQWDTRTWKRLQRWRVSEGWTFSVGFTPGGIVRRLFSAAWFRRRPARFGVRRGLPPVTDRKAAR